MVVKSMSPGFGCPEERLRRFSLRQSRFFCGYGERIAPTKAMFSEAAGRISKKAGLAAMAMVGAEETQGVGMPLVGGGSSALASRATFHWPWTFFQKVM